MPRSEMRFRFLILIGVGLLIGLGKPMLVAGQTVAVKPLAQAHAHNDYHHDRPLLDALDHGFCSVEADIYLVDGQLLVGHSQFELRKDRTLQRLYLDPLRDRAGENGGRVYRDGPVVTLLVDIKTDGANVYDELRKVLREYEDMLCAVENGQYVERAVQIVISGDRPIPEIAGDDQRLVGIDGRLTDLDTDMPAHLMPLISDRWTAHFQWRGDGPFPSDQRERLHSIVKQAHADGRRVRFWATPESKPLWEELLSAGVDHINTDRLDELRDFLEVHGRSESD